MFMCVRLFRLVCEWVFVSLINIGRFILVMILILFGLSREMVRLDGVLLNMLVRIRIFLF